MQYGYINWDRKLVPIDIAAIKLNVEPDLFYVRASQLKEISSLFLVKKDKQTYIDIGYIEAVAEFNTRIKNAAHEYWYYIRDHAKSDMEVSKLFKQFIKEDVSIKTLNAWFNTKFWAYHSQNLELLPISNRWIEFVKWAEYIIPKIEIYKLRKGYDRTTDTKENN